jgi:tetratricopeptide (TPR) repeat protein
MNAAELNNSLPFKAASFRRRTESGGVCVLVATLLLALSLSSCSGDPAEANQEGSKARSSVQPAAEVAVWKADLLTLCFENVSRLPLRTHKKKRASIQHELCLAALEAGMTDEARLWATQIPNWRRGQALAECALHEALRGHLDELDSLITAAKSQAAEIRADQLNQAWRADRISQRVDQVEAVLRHPGPVPSGLRAEKIPSAESIAVQLASAEDALKLLAPLQSNKPGANPDVVLPHLGAAVAVHDRFYADEDLRKQIEKLVTTGSSLLPAQIQYESRLALTDNALRQGDLASAKELVEGTARFVLGIRWDRLRDELSIRGQLGERFHRAGLAARAEEQLGEMLRLYDDNETKIINIYRAGALRSIAELCVTMGRLPEAREAYARAIEAGQVNPNSRPRGEDLARTCMSLVRCNLEPDAATRARIEAIATGLGTPW